MWLAGLLAFSRDVNMDLGATWTYSLCNRPITNRQISFRCNDQIDHNWVHKTCTTIRYNRDYSNLWQCRLHLTQRQQPTAQPNNHQRQRPQLQLPNQSQTTNKKTIKILQLNINRLTKKINEGIERQTTHGRRHNNTGDQLKQTNKTTESTHLCSHMERQIAQNRRRTNDIYQEPPNFHRHPYSTKYKPKNDRAPTHKNKHIKAENTRRL